ncbi:NAD-dependent protein deacetylase [bacterium]|nr:NAD-dependent protein deacetylase [bacterium]
MRRDITPYERLVMQTQEIFYRYQRAYARGGTPYEMSVRPRPPYEEQVERFAAMVTTADCVLVGAASGLSAAGGGDFYYEDNASFRKYFGKFADKYHLSGAFSGTTRQWESPEERWAYLATFLHTTQTAEIRAPYLDLREILAGKDFFVLTTNQDTQAVKAFPEDKVAQIQGDHRFFQCSRCCSDHLWDAVEPVRQMIGAMGEGTSVPTELIPRCPTCGQEAFPWVRGYGNMLEGERYHHEYQKVSDYLAAREGARILYLELGVGRMTPMFIQEPFWHLASANPNATYVAVNLQTDFLPKALEDRGVSLKADIADVLRDVRAKLGR